jgi:hypothetical protein
MTRTFRGIGALAVCAVFATTVAAGMQGLKPVTVPRGDGAPVITDGIFTAGEWDDALKIVVNDGVTLYLKEYRGVVFVGVRGQQSNGIGPSELSLAGSDGIIRKLHRSFALAEVVVPPDGPEPKLRLGFTSAWYANEQRRDDAEFVRLQKEGKDPMSIMQATNYPSDGIEFAIRRSKVPGQIWRLRLWASAFIDGKPGMVAYPPDSAERATDGWLELRLQ